VWHLPLREQSDEILRAVMQVCRSYQMPSPGLDYMALDPKRHYPELMAIAAFSDVDQEDFIASINAVDPDEQFPAAAFDPDEYRGRQLS
jgi:hypothetical protein